MKKDIKFISYTGEYPSLCYGTLTIEVNNKRYHLEDILISGGCVTFSDDWEEEVEEGEWTIDIKKLPEELQSLSADIADLVNKNVSWGCCGGCV